MNSLEFIKQHVTEWPVTVYITDNVTLHDNGAVYFGPMTEPHVDLSEHFAPSYYDGKVWTREEFEACGVVEYRYNDQCANPLLKREDDKYFYNIEGDWCEYNILPTSHWEHAVKISDSMAANYLKKPFSERKDGLFDAIEIETVNNVTSSNKYERELTDRQGNSATVDVYDVLQAFNVTCPATQHAIKKLLCTGVRGHKDGDTDLLEAREAITRAIELRS